MVIINKNASGKVNTFLYFSAITANLATFSAGGSYAWSSPAIPRLNGQIDPENNPLSETITSYEESWLASLMPLGAAMSTIISGYFSDKIGRKYTLLASSVPTTAGFALLTFGNVVMHFYIGRFLCGLGVGTLFIIMPIYVGEMAEKTNRGAVGCLFSFSISTGNLFFFLIIPYVTLREFGAINLAVPIIFALAFGIFVPESPYYYVAKNKLALAEISLLKLRFNNRKIIENELPEIIKNVEESYERKSGIKDIYLDRRIRKAVCIAITLMGFQQWSGVNVVFFYLQSIFEEAGSSFSTDTAILLVAITQFIASAAAIPMADKFGRRFLLLASSAGDALTIFISGIFFHLKQYTNINVSSFSWLPIVTLNLYIAFYSLGMGPMSFTLVGELFPPHIKSFAASVCIFVCLMSTFCASNIFPYLKDLIGMGYSLCFFGFICLVSFVFIFIKVPETKGKSLQEIQTLL